MRNLAPFASLQAASAYAAGDGGHLAAGPLSLEAVHAAGLGCDPSEILPQFDAFRRLVNGGKKYLTDLWREHDDSVRIFARNWEANGEYLDPGQPFLLDEHAAELAGVPERLRPTIVPLHYRIRASLADEREMVLTLKRGRDYGVRYRLLEGDLPVRDGTVPIHMASIEGILSLFEEWGRPYRKGERERLRRGLVLLEAGRGLQGLRRWKEPLSGFRLADRVLADWKDGPDGDKALAVLLHALLTRARKGLRGDPIFHGLSSGANFWDVLTCAAGELGYPATFLARQALGRGLERWRTRPALRADHIRGLLKLLNLLSVKSPWNVFYRLYAGPIDWAFPAGVSSGERRFFGFSGELEPESLAAMGFGPFLTAARLERGWTLEELARRVSPRLDRGISTARLGAIGANREQPDFETLRAIVEALDEEARASAFLAAYPTFAGLLPLRFDDGSVVVPPGPPFPDRPYPASLNAAPMVDTKGAQARLDADGFPFLMRRARGLKNLSVMAAAERLGLAHNYLRRMERDPRPDRKREVPGRLLLNLACQKKVYDLDPARALEAHRRSYWRGDPVVERMTERTFAGPVFIDEAGRAKLAACLRFDFQTPGEILYAWRNGLAPALLARRGFFLPTETQMARFLGVGSLRYRRWEDNLAVPSDEEARVLAEKLGLGPAEWLRLTQASARMRESLMKEGPVVDAPGLEAFPGLKRFVSLLCTGTFLKASDRDRVVETLAFLARRDPPSARYLDQAASRLDAGSREEARRLLHAVHRTEGRVRTWPRRVSRQGPVAACYHRHYGTGGPTLERLTQALANRGTQAVVFAEDGTIDVRSIALRPPFDPTPAAFAGIPDEILPQSARDLISQLFRHLVRERLVGSRKESSGLARKMRSLAESHPAGFGDFLQGLASARLGDGTWERKEWARLRQALASTEHFVTKWRGRLDWEGSPFRYFLQNRGRTRRLMYFHNRLNAGRVARVLFQGEEVAFESMPAARAVPASAPLPPPDRSGLLPGPFNGWGDEAFWSAQDPLRRETGLGPYFREGRLIRYYRLLHQVRLSALGEVFRGRWGLEAASHMELGRLAVPDEGTLRSVAEAIGLPPDLREAFVAHLHSSYADRVRVLTPPEPAAEEFPNASWTVVFSGRGESALKSLLKEEGIRARGRLTRGELERKTGLTPSQVFKLENEGELSAAALALYERRLGAGSERARRLKVLRAALDLARSPVNDLAGYHRAGRLLRFARFLVPDWPIRRVLSDLGLGADPTAYTRWEMGLTVMPAEVRSSFAAALVSRGAMSADDVPSFLSRLDALYSDPSVA